MLACIMHVQHCSQDGWMDDNCALCIQGFTYAHTLHTHAAEGSTVVQNASTRMIRFITKRQTI